MEDENKAELMRVLGARIARMRKTQKWSQGELGEKIGAANTTVSQVELGQKLPTLASFVRICEVFDVSADYLLNLGGVSKELFMGREARAQLRRLREGIRLALKRIVTGKLLP